MNIPTHVALLTGYATTVATCAPYLLSRSRLSERSPGLALVLWHATIGSAGFAIGLASLKLMSAVRFLPAAHGNPISAAVTLATVLAGLLISVFVSTRLVSAAVALLRDQRFTRRRHLDLVSMLGRHDPVLDATVIPSTAAAAYCVAGTKKVVITDHAVTLLEPRQLDAVLAHERAHLAGRHHLPVAWATLLVDAFPRVPVLERLREATSNLVELLADDRARRLVDGGSLATAIGLLAHAAPDGSLGATGGQALARVERLLDPPPRRKPSVLFAIAALTPLLIGIPLALASYPADRLC